MQVIDTRTNRTIFLRPTAALTADLQAHHARGCPHTEKEVRRATVASGATQFRHQCLACGELIGQAISRNSVPANVAPKDEVLPQRYQKKRESEYQAILQRHIDRQETHDSEWWDRYNAYLQTDAWRERRDRVLKRARGICEGCGLRPATQVHHLTYVHVCNEFLFELVAICTDCHESLHQDDSGMPCEGCRWQSERDDEFWCAKFEMPSISALSKEGPCGPNHTGLEPLK